VYAHLAPREAGVCGWRAGSGCSRRGRPVCGCALLWPRHRRIEDLNLSSAGRKIGIVRGLLARYNRPWFPSVTALFLRKRGHIFDRRAGCEPVTRKAAASDRDGHAGTLVQPVGVAKQRYGSTIANPSEVIAAPQSRKAHGVIESCRTTGHQRLCAHGRTWLKLLCGQRQRNALARAI